VTKQKAPRAVSHISIPGKVNKLSFHQDSRLTLESTKPSIRLLQGVFLRVKVP
jgi:hypothetical protein